MKRSFQGPTGLVARMLLICLLAGLAFLLPSFVQSTRAATAVNVTVNANSSLGVIPATAFGDNEAAWDGLLLDSATPSLLSATGAKVLRYPGGSLSDGYHWQSNTTETSFANPSNTFDAYMGMAQKAGMQPMITVDYGAGTAQEAAGWVQYANKGGSGYSGPVPTYSGGSSTGHTYGIKYWEVGNEVYGDGTYGSSWELNHNALGPTTYANNFVSYSKAMKAVDPTIKVGLVITTPGFWPDGVTSSSSPQPWNDTVLPIACTSADFVIVHWYPGSSSESATLATSSQIPTMVSAVRSKLNQYCGSHASAVQLMITETNAGSLNAGQRATAFYTGLFLDDMYMTMLENGVANVDWWQTHDDLLSSGAGGDPPAQTPFPPYYALQMLTHLGQAGDTMVSSSSSQSLVAVHAVKQANGNLAVLLDNEDPNNSYTISLGLTGYSANSTATIYSYGTSGGGITSTTGSSSSVTVAPYSLTTLVLQSGSGGGGPTPTPTPGTTPTPTPGTTPTPTPPPTGACSVHYAVASQWQGGFGANITITNTGSTTLNSWTLGFTFPGGQQVTQGWNGVFAQSGANVTVTNVSYNGTLAPGASVSPGFNGSWNGSNPNPTAFTLNGASCSVV
jgi:hypothetical protein